MSSVFAQDSKRPVWLRWGPALLAMAAIYVFSSVPSSGLPSFGAYDLFVKKGGHMLGYCLLALAYLHGIGRRKPGAVWLAWTLAVLFASTDEFHQSFVPGRGPRLMDVGIDALGAGIGLLLAQVFWK